MSRANLNNLLPLQLVTLTLTTRHPNKSTPPEITELDPVTISDDAGYTVTCKYSGTDEPTSVAWTVDGATKTSSDSGYTVTPGSHNDQSKVRLVILRNIISIGGHQNLKDCNFSWIGISFSADV